MAGDFFINDLDLSIRQPIPAPKTGLELRPLTIFGSRPVILPTGATATAQSIAVSVSAGSAIAGASAGTQQATQYLVKQLEELASNPSVPVYIRWGGSVLHNGWYYVNNCEPYYSTISQGWAQVAMEVIYLGPGLNAGAAIWYGGGSLSTTYSGTGVTFIGFPLGSTHVPATSITRTGAEGAIPCAVSPSSSLNPLYYQRSGTVGDWFKGGVRIFDSMSSGGNAPPTDGTTWNASWLEVKGTEHEFQGDLILTNGLVLFVFNVGASRVARAYLWSTAKSTPAWQVVGDIKVNDNSSNVGTLVGIDLADITGRKGVVQVTLVTSAGNQVWMEWRLRRGRYHVHFDFSPLSQSNTASNAIALVPDQAPKAVFTSAAASDAAVSASSLGTPADYGYVAAFVNSATYPYIVGLLAQGDVTKVAPTNTSTTIGIGDTSGPAQGYLRTFGFFALPYGVSGSYSTANLQQEMESTTLAGGFISVADTGSSGGNVAKLPSGTAVGATATSAAFNLAAGAYDVWFRARVTSGSASVTLRLGLYDSTTGWVAGQYTDYAPNSLVSTYAAGPWLRVATAMQPTANPQQFRAEGINGSAPTDFWVDEAFLVPRTLSAAYSGPQDIWQQFIQDIEEEIAA